VKITIESTDQLVQVELPGSIAGIPGRIWEGKTESGVYVQCVITRIAVVAEDDQAQFEQELQECRPPEAVVAFPLRMVI
jgi:hypothetical protein